MSKMWMTIQEICSVLLRIQGYSASADSLQSAFYNLGVINELVKRLISDIALFEQEGD